MYELGNEGFDARGGRRLVGIANVVGGRGVEVTKESISKEPHGYLEKKRVRACPTQPVYNNFQEEEIRSYAPLQGPSAYSNIHSMIKIVSQATSAGPSSVAHEQSMLEQYSSRACSSMSSMGVPRAEHARA